MRYWWLDDRPQRLQRLLLGVYQGKKHIPIGRVGTGFPRKLLDWLVPRLKEREVKESPFAGKPLDQAGTGCRHRDDELDQ